MAKVTYTMIKFVGFSQTQESVHAYLESANRTRKGEFSDGTQLLITFGCGLLGKNFQCNCYRADGKPSVLKVKAREQIKWMGAKSIRNGNIKLVYERPWNQIHHNRNPYWSPMAIVDLWYLEEFLRTWYFVISFYLLAQMDPCK